VTNLFNDGLEPNASNWTFSASTGTNRWGRDNTYAHSGTYALFADDTPAATSDSVAAMNSSIVLPAVAYLHFDHAYGFNGSGPDGGVVEYSTDGGTFWNDAGSLFQINGYNGVITAGPLNARNGFISDSHGYISSRLLLTSLAGQSVRFRFRMGLNSSGADLGWAVDDVRIYTCSDNSIPVYIPAVFRNYPPAWQNIVNEGFEGTWPSAGWTVTDPGYDQYFWGKRNCRAATGSNSAWAMGAGLLGSGLGCGADYINYAYSWMVYGPFSLADATAAELSLRLWLNSELNFDDVCIAASTNATTNFNGTCYTGTTGGVFAASPFVLNLAAVPTLGNLTGQSNVWVAVVFQSDNSITLAEGAHVDDLLLRKCSGGCAAVSADTLGQEQVTSYTVTLDAPSDLAPNQR